ncbi:coiled-coil domain-containing protein [Anaerocolumna xylanovorans]|uniref:N-terminal domain of peptidoglycan hydrolase CwlO-containing protein n=1 Tax=Anaerocolumna xylanovorans DSM 12503 TaxID=1121345 RepID=A0A1M7XZY2_9FIRM|nr:hypothetical protein [Anaerocolumna xylanovorans]SHO44756.1 N-terminal domain of peptidoglycan hydrolase CwlO-containing protein [Anaerocolumna xylanovorans DSM 12503]
MRKRIRITAGLMAGVLILLMLFKIQTFGENSKVKETEDKVLKISEEEKENLEILFTINQKWEELQKQADGTTEKIKQLTIEKEKLESEIDSINNSYNKQRDTLGKILVAYERKGTASYLDALLSAGDLKTFIRSVNILRDLTGGVNKLLMDLKENEEKLSEDKKKLSDKITELKEEEKELTLQIEQQAKLKAEQEAFLWSLKEEKGHYEDQLELLKATWEGAKEYFKGDFAKEFEEKIQSGAITTEDLKLHIDFLKISGELKEEKLNEALLPIAFHFEEGKAQLVVPDRALTLTGTFEIKDSASLIFQVTEGTFYGLPLEENSISELFPEGFPVIDLAALMQNMQFNIKLNQVKLKKGVLEFTLKPVF